MTPFPLLCDAQVALEEVEAALRGRYGVRVDSVDVIGRSIAAQHRRWYGTITLRANVCVDDAAVRCDLVATSKTWTRDDGAFLSSLRTEIEEGVRNRLARREAGL